MQLLRLVKLITQRIVLVILVAVGVRENGSVWLQNANITRRLFANHNHLQPLSLDLHQQRLIVEQGRKAGTGLRRAL
jgi:streptomycin 6-kinase